jgi:hypothetical protein
MRISYWAADVRGLLEETELVVSAAAQSVGAVDSAVEGGRGRTYTSDITQTFEGSSPRTVLRFTN